MQCEGKRCLLKAVQLILFFLVTAWFSSSLNCSVHIVMYAYYGLAAIPSLRNKLWWKKYITRFQLVSIWYQFSKDLIIIIIVFHVKTFSNAYIFLIRSNHFAFVEWEVNLINNRESDAEIISTAINQFCNSCIPTARLHSMEKYCIRPRSTSFAGWNISYPTSDKLVQ